MIKTKLCLLTSLVLCIIILALSIPTFAGDDTKNPMRSVVYDYTLLAPLGIVSDNGRLLVWKAYLKGDVNGLILWWFDLPMKTPLSHQDFVINLYSSRWEIFDSDPMPSDGSGGVGSNPDAKLLLAGISTGETLTPSDPEGQDGIWDGVGKVTEASIKFRHWIGCIMYEGGPVVFTSPTGSPGKVRIYPHGFRPRDLLDKSVIKSIKEINKPTKFKVLNNYPNPFNPTTTIVFDLIEATQIKIDIYNNAGQKVKTLLDKEMLAGNHKVEWNASGMASGVYYFKVHANGIQDVKRMILVK